MLPFTTENSATDSQFQIQILETFKNAKTETIISYLRSSHKHFKRTLIPEIEQDFTELLKLFPNELSINVMFNLFVKFQISLELHMQIEEETLFPEILNKHVLAKDLIEHSGVHEEPFLTEIISYLKRQTYGNNPFCQILIHRLMHFNEELKKHSWIEGHLI